MRVRLVVTLLGVDVAIDAVAGGAAAAETAAADSVDAGPLPAYE